MCSALIVSRHSSSKKKDIVKTGEKVPPINGSLSYRRTSTEDFVPIIIP